MRSGRRAISFSASPGADRSETIPPSKGTTSCWISSPTPCLRSCATSLRPIMPAAPMTRIRFMELASPVGIPDAPPWRAAGYAPRFVVRAVREILAHDALGGVAEIIEPERVVRPDQDEKSLLDRRGLRIVLDRVLRPVRGGDVRGALHVVARHVHLVGRERVHQVAHAVGGVRCVLGVRIA